MMPIDLHETAAGPSVHVYPSEEPPNSEPLAKTMNQIRKWGCRFDGKDPVSFLEQVEELKEEYGYNRPQMLRGLPELLKGH